MTLSECSKVKNDSRVRFLIVSNQRCGSTWLETMLGELDDVSVDFEFKWMPTYEPENIHKVIPDELFSCSKALDEISTNSTIVGSKLVLDLRHHSEIEYRNLKKTIEHGIRIIHLSRNYEDLYLSYLRGSINILENTSRNDGSALFSALKKHTTHDFPKLFDSIKSQEVSVDQVEEAMKVVSRHDSFIEQFSVDGFSYFKLDYQDVQFQFHDVVRFVGSQVSDEDIKNILKYPPTRKLPTTRPEVLVRNISEVQGICAKYEIRRNSVVNGNG